MRIAIVSQPRDMIHGPNVNSIGADSQQLSSALAAHDDVVVTAMERGDRRRGGTVVGPAPWTDSVRFASVPRSLVDAVGARIDRRRPDTRRVPWWASTLVGAGYRRGVARLLGSSPPDVVLLQHSALPAPSIRRACPDAVIVLHLHAPLVSQALTGPFRRAVAACDIVAGVSPGVAESSAELLGRRVEVLPNGVTPLRAVPEQPDTIVFAGAVSPEKGVHVLVQAFEDVQQRRPTARLRLVGGIGARSVGGVLDDDDDDPFVAAIRPLFEGDYGEHLRGLQSPAAAAATTFVGPLPRQAALDEIAGASVLAFPSIWSEGFGLPPLEAMSAGTVPVVSRRGELPNLVEDGVVGLVVPPDDPTALAEALLCLLEDDDLRRRLGDAGRARARERHSWSAVAQRLRELVSQA